MSERTSIIERLQRAAKNAEETRGWLANHEDAENLWSEQTEYDEDAKAIREAAEVLAATQEENRRLVEALAEVEQKLGTFSTHVLNTLRDKTHSDIALEHEADAWRRDAEIWKARALAAEAKIATQPTPDQ
jgi:hypothetical protein